MNEIKIHMLNRYIYKKKKPTPFPRVRKFEGDIFGDFEMKRKYVGEVCNQIGWEGRTDGRTDVVVDSAVDGKE